MQYQRALSVLLPPSQVLVCSGLGGESVGSAVVCKSCKYICYLQSKAFKYGGIGRKYCCRECQVAAAEEADFAFVPGYRPVGEGC